METESSENYTYWQENGSGWLEEYERRKSHLQYFHLQEIFLAEYFRRHAPARVLEFGCGVGRHLRNLRELAGIDVFGFDQSPTMVAEMNKWAPEKWIAEHVRLGAPTGQLPFEDNSFDVVFSCEVLIHVRPEHIQATIAELARISSRALLHLEPGPEAALARDAHGGCWGHDLIAAYDALGLKAVALPKLYSCQTPIQVTLDGERPMEPPFGDVACTLFRRMEAALKPRLDREMNQAGCDQIGSAAPDGA